jgi:hypothetical protein
MSSSNNGSWPKIFAKDVSRVFSDSADRTISTFSAVNGNNLSSLTGGKVCTQLDLKNDIKTCVEDNQSYVIGIKNTSLSSNYRLHNIGLWINIDNLVKGVSYLKIADSIYNDFNISASDGFRYQMVSSTDYSNPSFFTFSYGNLKTTLDNSSLLSYLNSESGLVSSMDLTNQLSIDDMSNVSLDLTYLASNRYCSGSTVSADAKLKYNSTVSEYRSKSLVMTNVLNYNSKTEFKDVLFSGAFEKSESISGLYPRVSSGAQFLMIKFGQAP